MATLGDFELDQIYTGDARELAKSIPDGSVDLILCDPVYWELWQYEWLGEIAERVLRQGASVIAQVGSEYRYEAETEMRKSSLKPLPLLAQVYDMAFRRMFYPRVMQGWKPHLWFCNGEQKDRQGGWLFDRFHSHGFPHKNNHQWEDNPAFFLTIVQHLTNHDSIVLDPFTGSGTVPAVCKMLLRHYLAFEIDPKTADIARRRVAETQPPLFVLEHQQAELFGGAS